MPSHLFLPAIFKTAPSKILTVIQELGLTSNLKLVLDAGDAASVASASQTKWLDLSGNGYDFFRGTDATGTSDPTFAGTIGGQSGSEYWDDNFFTYDTSNESWMNNIHKNSALFTIMFWAWNPVDIVIVSDLQYITTNSGAGTGFYLGATSTGQMKFLVKNAGVDVLSLTPTLGAISAGGWVFVALAVDEAANVYRAASGSVANTLTTATGAATYSSPAAGNATNTMVINLRDRMRDVAMWEGVALTADQIRDYYLQTSQHFGIN